MKIAFVSGNREQLPDAVIPLGLLYVLAACPDHHQRELWDLCFEADPAEALRTRLEAFRPDVVALGLRNIQNNDFGGIGDNVAYYRELVDVVRRCSAATVVVGGSGFSVMPEQLMTELRPDYGIAGEGEVAFAELVLALESGQDRLPAVDGLLAWDGDQVVGNPRHQSFLDVHRLPRPERSVLDPRYLGSSGTDSIQTKRGCRLTCKYCTYPTIEGRAVRRRSPVAVADELSDMQRDRPELEHVFIVDSVFNVPPDHARAVCRELIDRGWSVPWTCYANPIGFDAELAELMAQAGCVGLEIGSDSGCDEVLRYLQKGFGTAAIRQVHRWAAQAGMKDCHTFMMGTPGETMDDVERTLQFITELDPYCAILMTWVDAHEAVAPEQAAERRELRSAIERRLRAVALEHPRWIVPAMGVNFNRRLFSALRRLGLHGPLWQHLHLADERARRFSGLRQPA